MTKWGQKKDFKDAGNALTWLDGRVHFGRVHFVVITELCTYCLCVYFICALCFNKKEKYFILFNRYCFKYIHIILSP